MAEPESIQLLHALSEHQDLHSGIFFTYGADLAFFEEAVLHPLWKNGCRNNLIFIDAERYADTVDDLGGSVTWVGRRYVLVPVRLGVLQSFHPKVVLLIGQERGRLLIGSGNLTFTGFGHNHEVFTCLDWTPDEPVLLHLFVQSWSLINAVLERWGHSDEAHKILRKVEYRADWLAPPAEPITEIQLLHTLDEPLIDQCSRALSGEAVRKITVLTPFLDDSTRALSELYHRFRPEELQLVLQKGRAVGDVQALERLREAGAPLKVYRFNDDERHLHAKIYIFETAEASYALTGSANCTRAAWLETCATGNLEVTLLRRADFPRHFDPLLKGCIAPRAITSFDEIKLKRRQLPALEEGTAIRLLDVSAEGGLLSVRFSVDSLPEDVSGLQLRLSSPRSHFIPLGRHDAGRHHIQLPISQELQALLTRPLSATLWGINSDGEPVDLRCNNLWITNIDVLRREVGRALPVNVHTAGYLAEMAVSSEDEWRDLYESLATLIVLDVAELKRRGGTYTASPPGKRSRSERDTEEREIEIRLVDATDEAEEQEEIAADLYHESQLYAWLEHVRGRLPGAAPDPSEPDDRRSRADLPEVNGSSSLQARDRRSEEGTDRPVSWPGSSGRRRRRQWTPSERVGQRFVNLLKKYIRSLTNVEYMQVVSVYHILTYYVVFQRILWLLHKHRVIDNQQFVRLATEINVGFFGSSEASPPVLLPWLRQHIRHTWHEEWHKAQVPLYALTSVIMSEHLIREVPDAPLKVQVCNQTPRVLSGIAAVMGTAPPEMDGEGIAEVAEVYGENADDLSHQIGRMVENNLSDVATVLDRWTHEATIALAEPGEPAFERLLHRARVDYGLARYYILALLHDVEAQITLCSDLIFWMRLAGDYGAATQWGEELVSLLLAQGESHKVAQELFDQGSKHFYDGHHKEAANKLRQSLVLAEQLGDEALSEKCKRYLGYTEFFLK